MVHGGGMADFMSMDRETVGRKTRALMKSGDVRYVDFVLSEVKANPLKALFNGLGAMSTFSETATRLAVYRSKLAQLESANATIAPGTEWKLMQIAALESRDATLDFNRMGTHAKALNMLQAFFNAGVQGTDKTVRTLVSPNSQNKAGAWARGFFTLTVPSALIYAMNRDEEWYKAQPAWMKNMFWLVSADGGKTILRVPKPFEFGLVFASFPERVWEWLETKDKRGMDQFLKLLQESVLGGALDSKSWMGTWFPPISSAMNANANYDPWRDEKIVKGSLENVANRYQFTESTSRFSRMLAGFLNDTTKGNLDLSPIKMDYWVQSTFAGLGKYGLSIASMFVGKDAHAPASTDFVHRAPVLKGFHARYPSPYDDRSNEFYEMLESSEIAAATVNTLMNKRMDPTEAIKELDRNGYWFMMSGPMSEAAQVVAAFSSAIELIKNDPSGDMSPKIKREKIDDLYLKRSQFMGKFIDEAKRNRNSIEEKVDLMIKNLQRRQ